MINFRYHVVSLTAVFLALAIGLIVGTAALNGPAANDLHDRVNQLSKSNSQYRARVNDLTAEVKNKEMFATELAPELLAGKLADRSVLVVSMPETATLVPQLDAMLGLSGAKITGHMEIQDSFVDPSNYSTLLRLATDSLTTAAISDVETNSDGVETSAGLLAAVLLNRTQTVTAASRTQILRTFEDDGYIKINGKSDGTDMITDPAESVVFLAPAAVRRPERRRRERLARHDRHPARRRRTDRYAARPGRHDRGRRGRRVRDRQRDRRRRRRRDPEQDRLHRRQRGHPAGSDRDRPGAQRAVRRPLRPLRPVVERDVDAAEVPRRMTGAARLAGRIALIGLGALAAQAALRAVRTAPGQDQLERTNFHGRTVSLAGGPALAAAATATAALGAGSPRVAAAALLAGGASGAVGFYDDIVGARPDQKASKGFRGHLAALRDGKITSGMVKIAGVGAAAFGAASLLDADTPSRYGPLGRALNVVLGAGVIAGSANLLNLLDLRPGRALKAGGLLATPLVLSRHGRGALLAGPLGAAAGLMPADLDEEIMLGDAGANSFGALIGLAAAARTGVAGRAALLGVITALTAASEKVSFTKVIASTPGLRELDALGRRTDHVPDGTSTERPRFYG